MTYDGALRRSVIDELLEVRRLNGSIPEWLVAAVAEGAGVNRSTVWRWVRSALGGVEADVSRTLHVTELSDEHIDVVFENVGNLSMAKKYLDKEFPEIEAMSLSTFRRLWKKVDPAIRAMAAGGADALLARQLRLIFTTTARNRIWHIDAMECPIWVIPDGAGSEPVKPWLITVQDDCSRRIMAVVLTLERPKSSDVVVAVADAMRIKYLSVDHERVGGIPEVIHTDNGAEFKNDLVTKGLARLGVIRKFSYPYRKYLNGKVERVQLTMQRELFARLPGYSQGPRSISRKDLFGLDEATIGELALLEYIFDWVDEYNSERPHSSLGGRTPNQVWCENTAPIRAAHPEAIRLSMLKAEKPRKVAQQGVFFDNCYYMAPELSRVVGHTVEVRHMPHDDSFVEVFFQDSWLCTAYPHADLTDEDRRRMSERNREQYSDARAHATRAAERRRALAAGSPGDLIVTTTDRADANGLYGGDEDYLELHESSGEEVAE